MAEGKKSFTAYCDWGEIFDSLSDVRAGKLAKHLFDYVRDKNPESKDEMVNLAFIQMKTTLKRDLKKWEKIVERNRENGKTGGRKPKKPSGLSGNPNKPKKADSDSDSDSDSDKEVNIPTREEFMDYAKTIEIYSPELNYSLNAKFDTWLEDKWRDGNGKKIIRWKTKLRSVMPYLERVKPRNGYVTQTIGKGDVKEMFGEVKK